MTETDGLNAAELYKELGILTKDKGRWKESMKLKKSFDRDAEQGTEVPGKGK